MVWMVPVRASSEASVRMPRPVFQPPVWVVLALPDEPNPYEVAPVLSWDSRAIVQGVVMNEILTRPDQRKWGRRG